MDGIENDLKSVIPDGTPIKHDLIVRSYMAERSIKKDNDRVVVEVNGAILKDKLLNPVDYKTDFKTWIDEQGLTKTQGKGGNDEGGGSTKKFGSVSEFVDHCTKINVNPNSEEAHKILAENKAEGFKYE